MRTFRLRTPPPTPSGHDATTGQRLVRRSFAFTRLPLILIAVLILNFAWESVRLNLDRGHLAEWPWRFTLVDMSTTANLLALTTGLYLARLQWARAQQPSLNFHIDDEGAIFDPNSDVWRMWISNSGPGSARVAVSEYRIAFLDSAGGDSEWTDIHGANQAMQGQGLVDGVDYFIRWTGTPALPAVTVFTDGIRVARFSIKALAVMTRFDLRIDMVDSVGDTHRRVMSYYDRLPSVTMDAIARHRNANAVANTPPG